MKQHFSFKICEYNFLEEKYRKIKIKSESEWNQKKGMKGAITVWGADEDDEDTFFHRK